MKRTILLSLLLGTWLCGCDGSGSATQDGGPCDFDEDCKSGFCDDEVCRPKDGSGGTIINGQACTSNEQCVSKNCYEGKICRTPNWGGTTKLEIGDSCSADSQCLSGCCKENFCISSGDKIPNGEACTSNEQCESNNCYEGKVCRTPTWGGNAKLDIGSVCTGNDKCSSNNCVSGVCNPEGVSSAKTANGEACTSNDQCATSNCYEGKVCRTANWGGTSGKVGNGKGCTSDTQCVSNNCYEGKICRAPSWGSTTKLEIGDACSSNDQCSSGYCYNNTVCRSKGGNNGGSVTTSDANKKYCDAIINDCELTDIYRTYKGCLESMDVLRYDKPNCIERWDKAYTCIAAQTCRDLERYDKSLSELHSGNEVSYSVPQNCQTLATHYVYCE